MPPLMGSLSPALRAADDSDDASEEDERVKRMGLAAEILMLGRQEDDDDEVSEAELEHACRRIGLFARHLAREQPMVAATATDDEEALMRIRFAARRLALGRQGDEDGEADDEEVEFAAARMGMFARTYALAAGMGCGGADN